MKLRTLLIALVATLPLVAQQKASPSIVKGFGPIKVTKPILLDSTNLSNTKFTDEMLLSYSISFPEHNRFENEIKADTAGYFKQIGRASCRERV